MRLIGHEYTKKLLAIAANAALKRNKAMPHTLFSGAPGCGKTTMARELARVNKLNFLSVVPNDLKDYNSVMRVLDQLNHEGYDPMGNRIGLIRPTILFLDEVHNLPLKGQELLGLAMERFVIESGQPNKFVWVPYFTLVGATTLSGKLSKPFRDRFKLTFTFQPYELEEMVDIVKMHALRLRVATSPDGFENIAKRSRGTPRVAVGYIESIRDRMSASDSVFAPVSMIDEVFSDLGIDDEGLTTGERRVLQALLEAGGPVSLDNLSIITEEDVKTLRGSTEPFLIKKGLIAVSGKGRLLTPKGVDYARSIGTKKFIKQEISFGAKRI
jgi:Holliday junction DNA helicase RuvB